MRLANAALVVLPIVVGCTLTQDPAAQPHPDPLGTGVRISSLQNPDSPDYKQAIANSAGVNVLVSSAVISWIDDFDETKDGKSRGTVYVQDVGSSEPYSGIDIFSPSYVPASLRPFAGDVLDLNGPYQEATGIGTAMFTTSGTLPQLAKPVGTFRYAFQTPTPVEIQLSDIDQLNYTTGRKWENMLVTIKDVYVFAGMPDTTGNRISYAMHQPTAMDGDEATITNELFDLKEKDYPSGTHFASVTGIVTWFYSFALAPRTRCDLVVADADADGGNACP